MKRTAERISSVLECPEQAELSILITGDDEIQELNRAYLGKDRPTDVLSFPQMDASAAQTDERGRPILLGDVVISVHTAERQADRLGVTLEQELNRLLVHGFLHLLGYEHEGDPVAARKMRRLEKRLMEILERDLEE